VTVARTMKASQDKKGTEKLNTLLKVSNLSFSLMLCLGHTLHVHAHYRLGLKTNEYVK
jgi:hypothetical protein